MIYKNEYFTICFVLGHCHCEAGFAPPLCALPGPGGSYDSGPATDPTSKYLLVQFLVVIELFVKELVQGNTTTIPIADF